MDQGTFDLGTPEEPQVKLCECCCGEPAPLARQTDTKRGYVKGQPVRFIAGHNNAVTAAANASRRAQEPPPEDKPCECGCGGIAPVSKVTNKVRGVVKGQPARFIQGHHARLAASQLEAERRAEAAGADAKLCECGCGLPVPIATMTAKAKGHVKGQPVRFIAGHKPGVKGPKPQQQRLFLEASQRVGKSVVLDPDLPYWETNQKRNVRAVRLRCDCTVEYVRRIGVLFKNLGTAACTDCARHGDLSGRQFGKLAVIRRSEAGPSQGKRSPTSWWLCRCECENEVVRSRKSLAGGHSVNCGCEKSGPWRRVARGESAFSGLLRSYKSGAAARELAWELGNDEFRRLTQLDCHYCGTAPYATFKGQRPSSGNFTYNGVDRLDSSLGYLAGNCVPACWPCNYAKRDRTYQEFMEWIFRLVSFYFFHPELMPARYLGGQVKS